MNNVFIINGHQPSPFSEGKLNRTLVESATENLSKKGFNVRVSEVAKGYDINKEIDNHQWADAVIMQFPVNWMGVPWSLKKYMDEVYTAGMDGRLCAGDGRTEEAPKANYGLGGTLKDTSYMLSLTFNAPTEAFNDPTQAFFGGASVDDLMQPMHFNAKFFDMTPLPTFSAHDVVKDPRVDEVLSRLEEHLDKVFDYAQRRSGTAVA